MKIAEVIGNVTLSKCHDSLRGGRWRIIVPLGQDGLEDRSLDRQEPLVAYDEMSPGDRALVGFSDGGEAAAPFHPDTKPIDAYIALMIDHLEIENLKEN